MYSKHSSAKHPLHFNVHANYIVVVALELLMLYVYKVALDVMFLRFVLPYFSYQPHFGRYGPPDFGRLAIGYLLLPALWLSVRPILASSRYPFSKMVVATQFFVLLLPALTVWSQQERPFFHLGFILLGFYILEAAVLFLPRISFPSLGPSLATIFLLVVALLEMYVYVGLIASGGLQRINFNLLDVYVVREKYLQHIFPLADRLVPWVGNIFNPALFIYGVHTRRVGLGILALILQLALFAMTNFKSHLIMPLVVYIIWYIVQRLEFPLAILLGAVGSALLTVTAVFLDNAFLIGSLFRRVYFVPPALHSLYFDYFSGHVHAYMSGSTFGRILELLGVHMPYMSSSVKVIAEAFWGTSISPNVGWVGAAFADFGVWGIVATAILLAVVIRIGDSLSKLYTAKGIPEAMAFVFAFSITNSALITSFVTHGGSLALLILWLMHSAFRRDERKVA